MRAVNSWLRRASAASAFAHLQQSRIDGLGLGLFVDFAGAPPFQNHARDARHIVPHGEIGYRRFVRKSEMIDALFDSAAVVAEDLPHTNAGYPIIDTNLQRHFVERENGRVGLLPVSGDQHARIRHRPSGQGKRRHQNAPSHRSAPSAIRTRPLSVPT